MKGLWLKGIGNLMETPKCYSREFGVGEIGHREL